MNQPLAFVTFEEFPRLTPDDRLAAAALEEAGIPVRPLRWDDAEADWSAFRAVILRSTWDYHLRPGEFRRWLDRLDAAGARVWNPTDILRWNMDKLYLQDLEENGVAVTPSVWLPQGAKATLADILERKGWTQAVVKPTVSASAYQTLLIPAAEADRRQPEFAALLAAGSLVVQPFLEEVRTRGEWSLLFFDKQFSHAVLKRPAEGDFRVQMQFGGREQAATPSETLVAQAAAILDEIEAPLLYARVDGVEQNGRFVLMELELIEPVLFFGHAPEATARFAQALDHYLKTEMRV